MTERIITIFLLLGSTIYLLVAHQLAFGSLQSPKSGFLPMLTGIIAVLVAIVILSTTLHTKKATTEKEVDWTRFLFLIIGLVFYIMIFTIAGYFSGTFIFLFYFFKISDTKGWFLPLGMAFISSSVFYIIFKYYLAVTLP